MHELSLSSSTVRTMLAPPATAHRDVRCTVHVRGRVQGVGLRPFVHRTAVELGLRGAVWNAAADLVADVEGDPRSLGELVRRLRRSAPRGSRIESIHLTRGALAGHTGFAVRASEPDARSSSVPRIPPDVVTCASCLAEVRDANDRRHGHAFTSCADCGPRYSIARALPFDRARTSMAAFEPCARCAAELVDPASRRFHAETSACPECGPKLWCEPATTRAPLAEAARVLAGGGILALKGLGGFHLACDARSDGAVNRLRARKQRGAKPLAVMFADVAAVEREAEVEPAARDALLSPRGPIVLLPRRPVSSLAAAVAPGLRELGCFLPTTPLHHLLLARVGRPLVMTSGNLADEPPCATNEEARERLGRIADLLLLHDREIVSPVDDSVVRIVRGRERVLRRARGHAPETLALPLDVPPLLAIGSDRNCAPCLADGCDAVLLQHVGDLAKPVAQVRHARLREDLAHRLGIAPELVAHDLHPGHHGTRIAHELARALGVQRVAVQHHHAHVAACLAEHGRLGPVIGVAWDGTGHGADGTVWGGEVLVASIASAARVARIRPVALPAGDAAVREPWRMALAHLAAAGLADERVGAPASARAVVRAMIAGGMNAPLTSSAGRLFDAVAALAGLRSRTSYEGQAAMELEAVSAPGATPYPLPLTGTADRLELDPRPLVRAVAADAARGVGAAEIGSRFHASLAAAIGAACEAVRVRTGLATVALTGGCFQNRLFVELAAAELERGGFEVLLPERVPPGDGGLALGQAVVAGGKVRGVPGDPR